MAAVQLPEARHEFDALLENVALTVLEKRWCKGKCVNGSMPVKGVEDVVSRLGCSVTQGELDSIVKAAGCGAVVSEDQLLFVVRCLKWLHRANTAHPDVETKQAFRTVEDNEGRVDVSKMREICSEFCLTFDCGNFLEEVFENQGVTYEAFRDILQKEEQRCIVEAQTPKTECSSQTSCMPSPKNVKPSHSPRPATDPTTVRIRHLLKLKKNMDPNFSSRSSLVISPGKASSSNAEEEPPGSPFYRAIRSTQEDWLLLNKKQVLQEMQHLMATTTCDDIVKARCGLNKAVRCRKFGTSPLVEYTMQQNVPLVKIHPSLPVIDIDSPQPVGFEDVAKLNNKRWNATSESFRPFSAHRKNFPSAPFAPVLTLNECGLESLYLSPSTPEEIPISTPPKWTRDDLHKSLRVVEAVRSVRRRIQRPL